jgi:hypothetical protein
MFESKFANIIRFQLLLIALAAWAANSLSFGQTVPAPGSGSAVPSIFLKALSVESIVSLDQIASLNAPALTSDVMASINAGAQELRQQINYDATSKTLTVTGLLEQPGSPLPTPSGSSGIVTVWNYTVAVDRADVATKPSYAAAFVGTISADPGSTPFGEAAGSLITIATAFNMPVDPAPVAQTSFHAISTSLAGAGIVFSKNGMGTVSLSFTSNTAVPTAVAGPKNFISPTNQFQLDAGKSSDPNGGPLTYHWTFLPVYGQTLNITGADTATPTVSLPDYSNAIGDYTFQLTVSNSNGLSSTDTVTVTYDPSVANPSD